MFYAISKEIREHKKLIIFYVSLCMVLAVFCSPFFGISDLNIVRASEEGTVPAGETIYTLTNLFMGKSIRNLAGAYSSVVGVSAEPFTALLYLGLMENINRACGSPLDIVSTPAGNPIVLLLVHCFLLPAN